MTACEAVQGTSDTLMSVFLCIMNSLLTYNIGAAILSVCPSVRNTPVLSQNG